MTAETTDARALDAQTREAVLRAVQLAKEHGWTRDDLHAWFARRGVALSQYLAAVQGDEVPGEIAGALAVISIVGLQDDSDDFPDLPEAMRAARRWLLWRSEPVEGGKPRKTPYYATGGRRGAGLQLDSAEDVAQLVGYREACRVLRNNDYTGLGFALGEDGAGHWQGIDLDNLAEHPGLDFLVRDGLPGYTERSPSGNGVHAIGYGRAFGSLGSNTTGIEAYCRGRYFTVTASGADGELADLADFVEKRLAPLHSHKPQNTKAAEGGDLGGGTLAGSLAAADLRKALTAMRADDYDLWIRMGLALKGLGDVGRSLWLEWSQTSDKYDPADAARRWDGFAPSEISFKSVFAEAQSRGWSNPGSGGARPQDHAGTGAEFDPETGEINEEDGPFRASELSGDPPARQWIVPDWIVEGAVNSLYGDGGVGKTLLAQQLACSVSLGAPWLGLPTKQGTVLAVLCEDERDELHRRHNHIKDAMGHPIGNPFENVWLWPRVGDENVIVRWSKDGVATLSPFYASVVRQVEALNPTLLILDTLADVYGGNEIDRPQVNYFVKTVLGGLIKARAGQGKPLTILLLGHPSVAGKASGSGYSGSTAWNNAVRARMYLEKLKGDEDAPAPSDERVLTRGKANYAASGDETAVRLFFADGVLHAQEDAEDTDAILFAAKRDVLSMVSRAWASGQPYSAQKTHRRYIHTALVSELINGGFSPQIIRQAIRELTIDDGKITVGKSHDKRGYKTSDNAR